MGVYCAKVTVEFTTGIAPIGDASPSVRDAKRQVLALLERELTKGSLSSEGHGKLFGFKVKSVKVEKL